MFRLPMPKMPTTPPVLKEGEVRVVVAIHTLDRDIIEGIMLDLDLQNWPPPVARIETFWSKDDRGYQYTFHIRNITT